MGDVLSPWSVDRREEMTEAAPWTRAPGFGDIGRGGDREEAEAGAGRRWALGHDRGRFWERDRWNFGWCEVESEMQYRWLPSCHKMVLGHHSRSELFHQELGGGGFLATMEINPRAQKR